MSIAKNFKYKPGVYIRLEGFAPPQPTFDEISPDYPGNLTILADMARPRFDGEIYWIMSDRLKARADANGESKRIEETTGIKIKTRSDFPYGHIFIGQIETDNHVRIFPGGICVDVDLQGEMRQWD